MADEHFVHDIELNLHSVFFGIRALERAFGDSWPTWLTVVTVGGFFGWISAFGGAWKDAPIEGFETFKFFRSPGVAASVYLPSRSMV